MEAWNPKIGKIYYYIGVSIGEFLVMSTIFMDNSIDVYMKKSKNMFLIVKSAQGVLEEINKVWKGNK